MLEQFFGKLCVLTKDNLKYDALWALYRSDLGPKVREFAFNKSGKVREFYL